MTVLINGITYVPQIRIRISDTTLGQMLKQCRKDCKLSLDKAAKEIGCSKSYLWDVEADKVEPSLRMARQMSEAYGVPIATIAGAMK
jgi:transcriptional regulator with XRE-family HTH domain